MIRAVDRASDWLVEVLGILCIRLGLIESPTRGYRAAWPWARRVRDWWFVARMYPGLYRWMRARYTLVQAINAEAAVIRIRALQHGVDHKQVQRMMIDAGDPDDAIALAGDIADAIAMGVTYDQAVYLIMAYRVPR